MPRRKRRTFRPVEQLELPLVWAPEPLTEVERFEVGHFVGIRMSDKAWQLTVGPEKPSYLPQTLTPQEWWRDAAPEEFTLHQWSDCRGRVVSCRDDVESAPENIVLRATALRWLRAFNEAYQGWRMAQTF